MKKLFYILLFALMLTGCSSKPAEPETEKETNAFPYEGIPFEDETFGLTSVNVFCGESESGHGYYAYMVVRFDISQMSEDAKYWMFKDEDEFSIVKRFYPTAEVSECEENEMKHVWLTKIAKEITDDYVYIAYKTDKEYRHEFTKDNTRFTLFLDVYQTEKKSVDKRYQRYWWVNGSHGELNLPVLNWKDYTREVEQSVKDGKGNELNK